MTRWCCDSSKRTATRMSVTIQMRRRCTRQLAKGRYLVAWLLLKRGADPQGKLRFGKTAMDLAEAGGHIAVKRLLGSYRRLIPQFQLQRTKIIYNFLVHCKLS